MENETHPKHEEKVRVRFTTQYNEVLNIYKDCSVLKTIIQDLNFDIANHGTVHSALIKQCEILVIGCPQMEFNDDQIRDIKNFVSKGGNLLIINGFGGDKGWGNNLAKLGGYFGINFERNDPSNAPRGINGLFREKFPPITTGIGTLHYDTKQRGIAYGGCTIGTSGTATKPIEIEFTGNRYSIVGIYYKKGHGRVVGTQLYQRYPIRERQKILEEKVGVL